MAQPQHTLLSILTSYLIPPSSLPTIIPYTHFLTLNKTSQTTDTITQHALKKLYQDLQFQRNIDIDTVQQNIERECARGPVVRARLRRRLVSELGEGEGKRIVDAKQEGGKGNDRKRKRDDHHDAENDQGEAIVKLESTEYSSLHDLRESTIDTNFFGTNGSVLPPTSRRYHTTESLLEAMQQSINDLEKEIKTIDAKSETVLGQMQETVGALSDLRYGKFARVSGVEGDETNAEAEVVDALTELTNTVRRKTQQRAKGKAAV